MPRPAESLAGSIKVAFEFVRSVPRAVNPGELKFPTGTGEGTAPAPKVAKLPEGYGAQLTLRLGNVAFPQGITSSPCALATGRSFLAYQVWCPARARQ